MYTKTYVHVCVYDTQLVYEYVQYVMCMSCMCVRVYVYPPVDQRCRSYCASSWPQGQQSWWSAKGDKERRAKVN